MPQTRPKTCWPSWPRPGCCAGINLSNFLLVSGRSPAGEPEGVAPDMARAIADHLGVPVAYVTFPRPGELADAAGKGIWDIGLIAAEPARAEVIAFSPAYAEIEATYLVPAGSPIASIAEVDRPGVRIAVAARAAYDLWLSRHLEHAQLVARRRPRWLLRPLRRGKPRRARRPSPAPAPGHRKTPRRPASRRQIHRRAAGGRHRQDQRSRRPFSPVLRQGRQGLWPGRPPDRAPPNPRPLGRTAGLMSSQAISIRRARLSVSDCVRADPIQVTISRRAADDDFVIKQRFIQSLSHIGRIINEFGQFLYGD